MYADNDIRTIKSALALMGTAKPGYTPRQSQRKLIATACQLFAEKAPKTNLAVVEAPTGTGKTLGYLIGALPALSRGEKVIVCPSTVALQQQLVTEDVPLLKSIAGFDLKVAIAKGRSRYACLRKLAITPSTLSVRLNTAFVDGSWNGDLDEWATPVKANEWEALKASSLDCTGSRCPSFQACPYQAARKAVTEAQIVVANHALLISDLMIGGGVVLPAVKDSLLIVDEGHHLTEHARSAWKRTLNPVHAASALEQCAAALSQKDAGAAPSLKAAAKQLHGVSHKIDSLFSASRPLSEDAENNEHLICRFRNGTIPASLKLATADAKSAATKAQEVLDQYIAQSSYTEPAPAYIVGARSALRLTLEACDLLLHASEGRAAPTAKWLTYRNGHYRVHAARVNVADWLSDVLWTRSKRTLVVSATLSSLGSFRSYSRAAGLPRDTHFLRLPGVFNYAEQGTLMLPRMKSSPKDSQSHTEEVTDMLPSLLAMERGSLVLFASASQMQAVAEGLPEAWRSVVIQQGDAPIKELIRRHKQRIDDGQRSVLFGLASLAEGIDLPGDYCSHVIIARLPFRVPDDPLIQTEHEWLARIGVDAFAEVELPLVSQRLHQSVGRAIRRESDKSLITILDPRMTSTRYGRRLLEALPPFRRAALVSETESGQSAVA